MRLRYLAVLVVCGFLFAGPGVLQAAGPDYKEGKWEITTTIEMPGMPKEMAGKPQVFKMCMKKDEPVPQPKEKGAEKQCEIIDKKITGNTVNWKLKCKNGTEGTGTITYTKTSYSGSQTMVMNHGGKKVTMKSTMKGRYLGPCPKKG